MTLSDKIEAGLRALYEAAGEPYGDDGLERWALRMCEIGRFVIGEGGAVTWEEKG